MKTRTAIRALSRLWLLPFGRTIAAAVLFLASACVALAGDPVTCPGVDLVETELTNGTSSGYYIPGLKLIILNRAILVKYAPSVQQFILAHECAHADPAVGDDENEADCAASKRGIQEGWLGAQDMIKVCVHLARFPADATHPPIQARCANIRRCAREADMEMARARKPEKDIVQTPLMAHNFE